MKTLSRRQFIQRFVRRGCLIGTGVLASSFFKEPTTHAADDQLLPIIDTHQHLWDLVKVRPPWLADAAKILRQRYDTEEFVKATQGLNVVKAVYMEVDVAPNEHLSEAKRVIALSKSDANPTVAAVISGRPDSVEFAPYIRQFADNPYIKGVRQVMHVDGTPPGFCLRSQFGKSMALLGELDKSFDICIRPSELHDAVKLCHAYPDTRFILDHCGNADPTAFLPTEQLEKEPWHNKTTWLRDIESLSKCDNLTCKISGIVARAPKDWTPDHLAPIINHCLDSFGPDRVVYGGDWPVCLLGASYAKWVNGLKAVIANRPLEQQRKLLHDNAQRIYKLS